MLPLIPVPSGEPIQDWMATWTLRPGYPILKADIVSPPGSNPSAPQQLVLRQQPVSLGPASAQQTHGGDGTEGAQTTDQANETPPVWWLPIAVAYPVSFLESTRACAGELKRSLQPTE